MVNEPDILYTIAVKLDGVRVVKYRVRAPNVIVALAKAENSAFEIFGDDADLAVEFVSAETL